MTKALVVLSGGQDSVTCLAWAVANFDSVEAITFDYGQRHRIEIACAQVACDELGVPAPMVLNVEALALVATSALTNNHDDVKAAHPLHKDLPASYVPNRNAMFLTLAHAYAQTIGADTLVTGVCQTDYSGYPDCRQEFIDAIGAALNLGSDSAVKISTPLMHLDKAQTWELAAKLGQLDLVINFSHTCYEGDHSTKHEWGYGCGSCPSCLLRKNGFEKFLAS